MNLRCAAYIRGYGGAHATVLCGEPAQFMIKGWSLCERCATAFARSRTNEPFTLRLRRK